MPAVSFGGLLVVAAIAVCAPLLVGLVRWIRVPGVVLEILAGIAVGPSGLGWVEIDLPIQILALIGLAFLQQRRCPRGHGGEAWVIQPWRAERRG